MHRLHARVGFGINARRRAQLTKEKCIQLDRLGSKLPAAHRPSPGRVIGVTSLQSQVPSRTATEVQDALHHYDGCNECIREQPSPPSSLPLKTAPAVLTSPRCGTGPLHPVTQWTLGCACGCVFLGCVCTVRASYTAPTPTLCDGG